MILFQKYKIKSLLLL